MQKEIRTVCYDESLRLEAYRFEGVAQSFPNHFHDYYVIGFIEAGARRLICRNKEYSVGRGNILLLNPSDSHSCVQCDGGAFDYRGLNISRETMQSLAKEVTGRKELVRFSKNVIQDDELSGSLHSLHRMIMDGWEAFEKEEAFFLFFSLLMRRYGQPFLEDDSSCGKEIESVCAWMEERFAERITLDELCIYSGLSKSTLLRGFTKAKGLTPYRFLQTIRVGRAKELLERGVSVAEAAAQTGFSDQSHFSNFFHMFIGLSPAVYRRVFKEGGRKHG